MAVVLTDTRMALCFLLELNVLRLRIYVCCRSKPNGLFSIRFRWFYVYTTGLRLYTFGGHRRKISVFIKDVAIVAC